MGWTWFANLFRGRDKIKLSETPGLVEHFDPFSAIPAMSADKAMQLSTVFACVRLISETVGTLPCVLYERERGQGKRPVPDVSLYRLLHDSPSADFTAVEYFERMAADLCLWGNHYSEIYRGGRGGNEIVALYGLDPALVGAYRLADGGIRYTYDDPFGAWREIDERDMLHVRGFSRTADYIFGLSPISCARISLDIAASTDAVAANTYKNGMKPSGVVTTDRILTKEQRDQERRWISQMAGGVRSAGGLLVFEGGYKYQQMSLNPADAQMLENRTFNVEDICRWFRVPPYLVGHTQTSTSWGTGLEQQNRGFATYTLRPYLARIEAALQKKLIPADQQRRMVIEFNLEGLLRADSAGRANFYSTALQNGWMCRNDVRAKENLGKIDGGDVFTVQSNLIPLSDIDKNDAQTDGEGPDEEN